MGKAFHEHFVVIFNKGDKAMLHLRIKSAEDGKDVLEEVLWI